jgi:DedD protein
MITSRSGSSGSSSAPPAPQSIEMVRRRARHRLIGAAVLVLLGVLGFPMLFDTEPRPVAGDIPIEIPARGTTPALSEPREPAAASSGEVTTESASAEPSKSGDAAPTSSTVTAVESLDAREEVMEPASKPSADTAAKAAPKSDKVTPTPTTATAAKDAGAQNAAKDAARVAAKEQEIKDKAVASKAAAAESARAKSLLESKAPAGAERLVVQVGAFAEAQSARATRLKLERAGFKTYTHVAETSAGKLIRVRVGPFSTRSEADRAAAKVKALGLPARILSL